ncbi:MAG TPA: hypothetical protein VF638_12965 [Sphingomonas sp.]
MSGRFSGPPFARTERVPSWDSKMDRPSLVASEMRAEARRLLLMADELDPQTIVLEPIRCSQSIRDDVWLAILFAMVAIVALLIW